MKNSTDKIWACPLCGQHISSMLVAVGDKCWHDGREVTPVLMEIDEALSRCYEDIERLEERTAYASNNLETLKGIKRRDYQTKMDDQPRQEDGA